MTSVIGLNDLETIKENLSIYQFYKTSWRSTMFYVVTSPLNCRINTSHNLNKNGNLV